MSASVLRLLVLAWALAPLRVWAPPSALLLAWVLPLLVPARVLAQALVRRPARVRPAPPLRAWASPPASVQRPVRLRPVAPRRAWARPLLVPVLPPTLLLAWERVRRWRRPVCESATVRRRGRCRRDATCGHARAARLRSRGWPGRGCSNLQDIPRRTLHGRKSRRIRCTSLARCNRSLARSQVRLRRRVPTALRPRKSPS